jgi:inorganic pyrophosphatase
MSGSESFWNFADQLVVNHRSVIDRPKGSAHPRYPHVIYPLDYGYLEGTTSADGGGIDVWVGSGQDKQVTALVCTIDLVKRDTEIKLLLDCTDDEMKIVERFHNANEVGCLLVRRSRKE